MSGIHYIRITDHLKLLAVCRHLEQFCDQHPLVNYYYYVYDLKCVEFILLSMDESDLSHK